jgi:anthranilate phosphoribosyltransferase (EC 2.4.2.18)
VTEYTLTPEDLGLERAPVSAIAGGSPDENAADLEGVVSGEVTGPKRDVILANAGAAVYVAGLADSPSEGVGVAADAIDSGEAADAFERMRS